MEIKFKGATNFIDVEPYSAFKGEKEILLQDGIKYQVVNVKNHIVTKEDKCDPIFIGKAITILEMQNISRDMDELSCCQKFKRAMYI